MVGFTTSIYDDHVGHRTQFCIERVANPYLALAIVFEEWVTETYITPTIERLLQRITTFLHKVTSSAYIALRVFRLLMRLSSSSVTKIVNKWALRRISALENRASLKKKNGGET